MNVETLENHRLPPGEFGRRLGTLNDEDLTPGEGADQRTLTQKGRPDPRGTSKWKAKVEEIAEDRTIRRTDLASAIRTAAGSDSPSVCPKVGLISDAMRPPVTPVAAGGWPLVADRLCCFGQGRRRAGCQIASLDAPAQVRQGEPF